MSPHKDPKAGASRDRARARLRTLTSAALFATTGATVAIGIVVAREHPGKSGASTTTSGHTSGASTGTTSSSGSTGNTGSGNSGSTGNTGASSYTPSTSSQSPTVTSGGSGR